MREIQIGATGKWSGDVHRRVWSDRRPTEHMPALSTMYVVDPHDVAGSALAHKAANQKIAAELEAVGVLRTLTVNQALALADL